MDSHSSELLKIAAQGPCSCYYAHGSGGWSLDSKTGEAKSNFDLGPKTECFRCRARRALERDGVEYEKVDHLPTTVTL